MAVRGERGGGALSCGADEKRGAWERSSGVRGLSSARFAAGGRSDERVEWASGGLALGLTGKLRALDDLLGVFDGGAAGDFAVDELG